MGEEAQSARPWGRCGRWARDGSDSGLQATFVRDVNYPDDATVTAGETIVKQWEFLNPADAPEWPEGTKLVYIRGDRDMLGEVVEFPVTRASPGEKTIVSVELKVPKTAGRCKVKFRLADGKGAVFGAKCWAKLMVVTTAAKGDAADAKREPEAFHHGRNGRWGRQEASGLQAKFVRDVNYPDGAKVAAGKTITKQWEFLNPADAPQWPEGTKLVYIRGDRELLGEAVEFPVARAAPGEKILVSVELKVPNAAGRCKAKFRLADGKGALFGAKCWAELLVVKEEDAKRAIPAPSLPSVAAPAPAAAAAVHSASVPASACLDLYPEQLALLEQMGFKNRTLNKSTLARCGGDVHRAAVWLSN